MLARLALLLVLLGAPGAAQEGAAPSPTAVFLLDTSGSMAIGSRWAQATAALQERCAVLPPEARFALLCFHEEVAPQWRGWEACGPQGSERLARALARLRPEPSRGTDLAQALEAALALRPDRIVLLSDGVGTSGQDRLAPVASRLEAAARAGLRLDVVALHGGRFGLDPELEPLAAVEAWLRDLARRGGGELTLLGEGGVAPAPAPAAATAPSLVLLPRRGEGELRGPLPLGASLRLRVLDPQAGRDPYPWVSEYGACGKVELEVEGAGRLLARAQDLELRAREDGALEAALPLQLVERSGRTSSRALLLAAAPGATLTISWARGGERFSRSWTLEGATAAEAGDARPAAGPEAAAATGRPRRLSDFLDGNARFGDGER